MPGRTIALRRSRSAIETEEDADSVRAESRPSSAGSDSVKRARVNGNHRDIGTPGHLSSSNANPQRSRQTVKGSRNGRVNGAAEPEDGGFQTGAIVRVKVTNFVTYENAEFFPGPNLNMVIGPNGTGKSSLVCAICLGLGWGPAQLGRASSFGEFVKHGAKEAIVEIELQGEPDENHNTIVKVRITRENNKREWWLNNRSTGHKAVQAKMEKLNVQIGNLCQFLPQDKVSEFAAMKPVELLEATQQAAAPPQMRIWHDDLKRLRKEQKTLQIQNEEAQDTLANLEGRQQNLRAEVEKLQKRKEIQHRITLLDRAIPLGEYSVALKHFNEFKKKRKEAEIQLRKLEQEVEPLMRSVNQKQQYKRQIDTVFAERKAAVHKTEREADALVGEIEKLDEDIKGNDIEVAAQKENDAKRKQARQTLQQNIREHEIKLQRGEPEFDPKKWNTMTSDKEREERAIDAEMQELSLQNNEFIVRGREIRKEQVQAKEQLDSLDTQSGRQNTKLEHASKDTAKLWKWIQKNMDQFEKEVFGPPMVTCSVKDPRYANAVEALFPKNVLLTITAQTYNDNVKLGKCIKALQLSEVRLAISGNGNVNPPFSAERLQELGLDAWAVDLIEGPQPIISMLFGGSASQAVGLRDISDSQYERILQTREIPRYVARDQLCMTSYRSEYNQSSTQHKHINDARFWVDTPVDQSARREIEAKMQALSKEFSEIEDEKVKPLHDRLKELKEQRIEVKEEIKQIKDRKSAEQIVHGRWETLPNKIARLEESLRENDLQGEEFRERMKHISIKYDNEVLKRAQLGLQHKKLVASIRSCHEDLLEAAIRQIEADSDIESLKERNADNDRRLQEERQRMREAADESKSYKEKAAKALEVAQAIIADSTDEDVVEIKTFANEKTLEELANETAAEKSKLELIHAGNPNAIREFEKRQSQLEELEAKIQASSAELEHLDEKLTNIRNQWEPEIDRIVAEISEAFALNFETIGCSGEVSVHKDDDFDLWSIEIKVKFRENETLQLLDAHRQSGGERSVSTIFYLMALQSLAKSPFRVVDEINQGMDPRNERMVHERMVQIACQEHTSQYFLITPKLLTGLRYDRRMKVLCIASGEHMPENYKTLDVSKIIRKRRAMIAAR